MVLILNNMRYHLCSAIFQEVKLITLRAGARTLCTFYIIIYREAYRLLNIMFSQREIKKKDIIKKKKFVL